MEIFILLVCLFIYFIPAVEATRIGHRNAKAIAVLNAFLGWTVLGWIVALVWANLDDPKETMHEDNG